MKSASQLNYENFSSTLAENTIYYYRLICLVQQSRTIHLYVFIQQAKVSHTTD